MDIDRNDGENIQNIQNANNTNHVNQMNIENVIRHYWRLTIAQPHYFSHEGHTYRLDADLCVYEVNNNYELIRYYGSFWIHDRFNDPLLGYIEFEPIYLNDNRPNEVNLQRNVIVENERQRMLGDDDLSGNIINYYRNIIIQNLIWN
jgi:hypothetical protein